ncbi:hypothetical protein [Pedobacter montanisoli]|uniref:Uncharacterized protein n=1 Tax=Pedobacter montanisoli TaxID=2923277 RepID=A0ABS9ZU15_9SPHI|nr:hypothetical protein [Pedobacter montanisoli]MCJ0741852.1 hypothetical protein [Pedobacter montanisoli]
MMKNLKKLLFGLATLLVVFGLVFMVSAFTSSKKTATLKYRYTGNDETGLHTASNWDDVSSQPSPEGCEPGDEIPCLVQFDSGEYTDIQDFINQNPSLTDMIETNRIQSYKNEVVEP